MTHIPPKIRTATRRQVLAQGLAGTGALAFPFVARAQARELVINGAAPDSSWMNEKFGPFFEKKHRCKVIFEGARATINLEKLRAAKARPTSSLIFMDESTMPLAGADGLLEKMTPAMVPAMADLAEGAVRQQGTWVQFLHHWTGIAVNTASKIGAVSWASLWDPSLKGKVAIPSFQLTDGVHVFQQAAALQSGKPPAQALYDTEAAFAKLRQLKPNLLTVYSNLPQAFNLLEQGEARLFVSFSSYALPRKLAGAPVDLLPPAEGVYIVPQTLGIVKGGPNPELAALAVNELIGEEFQSFISARSGSLPVNRKVARPPTVPQSTRVHATDWDYVGKERAALMARYDREMQA